MTENIKFHPKTYVLSEELKKFFTVITGDTDLQQQLYETEKLSDVASIANDLGFKVSAAEILWAQAGRVLTILDEGSDDVENLLSGKKPKTGAQWGRGGGGFLDNAGFWLNQLATPTAETPMDLLINEFLKTQQTTALLQAKTFNDLAQLAQSTDFKELTAVTLLTHQAQKILNLEKTETEKLAHA